MKGWVTDMAVDKVDKKETEKLVVQSLNKIFINSSGQEIRALQDISFSMKEKEFSVVVGPSGCGKSTLLNIIGGLETATSGRITVDGREVSGPGADRGMVFQGYSLFPWLSVRENIQFGLRVKKMPKAQQKEKADQFIELVGLTDFADALPKTLSGGMKQRVAIARTLANEPSLLLMDEPFGALDAQTRIIMQEMLVDIRRKMDTTILFITHDIDEALLLGDNIYIMSRRPGCIREKMTIEYEGKRDHNVLVRPEFIERKMRIMEMLLQDSSDAAAGK